MVVAPTFALDYSRGLLPLFVALGTGPARSSIEVGPSEVRVRMGWAFRAVIPRRAVRSVRRDDGPVRGWGVHGWNGRWLVNGSSRGLVRVELDDVRARVIGVPVRLETLRVGTTEPDRLVELLTAR